MHWVKSRGPAGFWLSMAILLLIRPEFGLSSQGVGLATNAGALGSFIGAGVVLLALMHHPKGWLAVRLYAFASTWVFGILLLVNMGALYASEGGTSVVIALALATIASLAVFQYFHKPEIQALYSTGD
jgi:hypothetical protein